jgi:hypothetical protein
MKTVYLLLFVIAISCQKRHDIEDNKNADLNPKVTENVQTEIRFRTAKNNEIIRNDTLIKHFNFESLEELKCETKFLNKDYENEEYFIREYEIKICDTLFISALQKQSKKNKFEYVYFYKGKNFNITNYYGEMFSRKSELFFDFETRKAYKISNNKILLREQPSTWCGLANQMDFFQIVDLEKMEIAQFVDYDTIIK